MSPRRTAALALLATTALGGGAYADPRFTVTWHPLSLLTNVWQFEFEAAPTRWLSLHATPATVITLDGAPRPLGFAMDLGARAFPFGRAPSGFFLGAHLGAASWNIAGFDPTERGLGLRGGASVGFTFVFVRRLVLSMGGGVEYVHFAPSRQGDPYGEVLPFARLALGVAF